MESTDNSIFDQIFEQIQSLIDKVLNMEDEITQLKEENDALALRVTELESTITNGVAHHDNHDDDNHDELSKKELKNQIKTLKKELKAKEKELKKEFKAKEKELKKQLESKKDKKHHDDEDDD